MEPSEDFTAWWLEHEALTDAIAREAVHLAGRSVELRREAYRVEAEGWVRLHGTPTLRRALACGKLHVRGARAEYAAARLERERPALFGAGWRALSGALAKRARGGEVLAVPGVGNLSNKERNDLRWGWHRTGHRVFAYLYLWDVRIGVVVADDEVRP